MKKLFNNRGLVLFLLEALLALIVIVSIILEAVKINDIHTVNAMRSDFIAKQKKEERAFSRAERNLIKKTKETTPKVNDEKVLNGRLSPYLENTDAEVSVAIYSKKNNHIYQTTNSKRTTYPSASIIKADFLVELLHQKHKAGQSLDVNEQAVIQKMMEHSDNDAATNVYNQIGGYSGLARYFSNVGMDGSVALTATTPLDQIKTLNIIFYQSNYISETSRSYIEYLMGHVAEDQNWGISVGSKHFCLKNGWKQMPNDKWIINSMGQFGTGQNSCTIAIMSTGNKTEQSGEKLVEDLTKAVSSELKIK
ncbi:hypothetical protein OS787_04590 [Pediococcus pentosaceus]|uniref:hypothetical protein n=1 Tax=Pediococcus pentosaceus TaxID=1255 RepID=UPI003D80A024